MKSLSLSRVPWFVIVVFAGSQLALAQTAQITGRITDPSEAVIQGAAVTVTHVNKGIDRETHSNDEGYYSVPLLEPGSYRMIVQMPGFSPVTRSGIILGVDQVARIDFSLVVGEVTEKVMVHGQPSLVNTQTAEVRELVDSVRIDKLPLNGRNVLQLTLLGGGVLDSGGGLVNQGFISQNARVYPSASGGRADAMNFIFDGGTNNDRYTNVALPLPNPDAVQEFSFLTNSFSAEHGAASGGVVNVISKSGTNEFHGTMYNYLRNATLNASNFFTPGVSDRLKRNQAGFTVGGPVWLPNVYDGRNKTFFFLSWQNTWFRQSPVTANARTLTAAERKGDFSVLASQLNRNVIDPETGAPFPNNHVPQNRLDPIVLKIIERLPVGDPVNGFVTFRAARQIYDSPQWLARVDHQLGAKHRINVRYFYDFYDRVLDIDPQNPYLTGTSGNRHKAQSATLASTHIFSPKLLANFNFTFSRSHNPTIWRFPGLANNNPAVLGIQGFPSGFLQLSPPSVWSGYDGPSQFLASNNFQYQGSASYITGSHELKWGGEYIRSQINQQRSVPSGNWSFGTQFTGITEVSFLMGLPNSFSASGTFGEALRQNRMHFYFQDNFKVTRRLTLNLGVRYDPFLPWTETDFEKVTLFRPGLKSKRFPNLPIGAVVAGDPGVPEHGYARDLNNFAPRLGFALDPRGTGRTAIRGGIGIFFGQPVSASINQRAQVSAPFVVRADITSPGAKGPGGVANVFRTGTNDEIPNPFLQTAGVPPPAFPIPSPLLYVSTSPDYALPYTAQWNVSIEQQIGRDWAASATYLASKSTRLLMLWERNPAIYVPGNGADGRPLSTFGNIDQRRPYGPVFTSVQEIGSDGNSNFNALALKLRKTISGDHWWSESTVEANYTWSHSLDILSAVISPGGFLVRDPFNAHRDYGNADFDHRHRFVLSYVWSLPTLTARSPAIKGVLGGWSTASIVTLQDGNVFSISSGRDNNFDGLTDFADQVLASATLPDNRPKGEKILRWFNTDAFAVNAIGTHGNSGRNILRGPGLALVDFSVFKNFPLGKETRYLEFRSDFFNLLNRVNLSTPNTDRSSQNFGRIFSAGSPRILQFALKLHF